jgi:tetratricopeptide (TPR) repeat protein
MALWKKTIDDMQKQNNKNAAYILELINYQYGYIGWCIGNKKYDEAKQYIALGEKNIEKLKKINYQLSMLNAYKSAFYGFRIGLNKLQAPFIGPKSVDCAKLAIQLDANNPYGYIQIGNSEYYMPAAFGGSKTNAIEYYKKARMIMESDSIMIKNDWNYLSLLTQIALGYEELEQYNKAKAYYDLILRIEPQYKWVKEDLYPKLQLKMK